MKVDSVAVENVRSFKERETINFNDDFNIIIGPNGGGKSNLLDITSVTLNNYFLESHTVHDSGDQNQIRVDTNSGDVDKVLEKNLDRQGDDSVIEITLKVSNEDIQNIKNIYENIEELENAYSEYDDYHSIDTKFSHVDEWVDSGTVNDLSAGDILEFTITNGERETPQSTAETRYVQYLTSLDLFILLSDDLDSIDLQPVYFYFPPYRGGGTEDKEVSITSDNYYQQLHQYVNSTSRERASAIQLAQFKLAALMRSYEVGKGSESEFDEEQEVKLIKDNFRKIGFEWNMDVVDEMNNTYGMSIKKGDHEYRIDQMSSGEREITNFLLGILSTDIQNGLVIIDEPELHLHPRWQSLLLEVLNEIEDLTKNQFIFTTHSPSFITRQSIKM